MPIKNWRSADNNTLPYALEPIVLLVFFILAFALLFPDLVFLIRSPMGGHSSVLKDPSVSWAAFMPAFRDFRYELLEHGNILWSNLRSAGLPMLGNAVQGGPLFPLNLALIWLPDNLYWSVMPITRIILIAWGLYLISRHIFGLSLLASLIFALLAGFNINMIGWINHPWSNGVLAGIWYLYFCCSVLKNSAATRPTLVWHCIGLIISVFAMVTCGFPEASALAAIFAVALFTGFILTYWSQLKPTLLNGLSILIICHLIGFCISAIQIFALLEFIVISQALELREGFIDGVYVPDEAISASLAQLTSFWHSVEQSKYFNFHIGLFGLFFFIRGILLWLKVVDKPWLGFCCIAMMSLYVAKAFGLSTLISQIFAVTPVLAQSHFPLYFSPLFYFGAFYFSAVGIQSAVSAYHKNTKEKCLDLIVSVIAFIGVIAITMINLEHFNELELNDLINNFSKNTLMHLHAFLIGASLLIGSLTLTIVVRRFKFESGKPTLSYLILGLIITTWLLIELGHTLPKNFSTTDHWSLSLENDYQKTFNHAAIAAKLGKHELRGDDAYGDYVKYGIATINNGISAILPFDQRQMRMKLFQTDFAGYYPPKKAIKLWSWEALSTNLMIVGTTPRSYRQWSVTDRDQTIKPKNINFNKPLTKEKTTLLYLEGTTAGYFKTITSLSPWIHFKGSKSEFWVEGNFAGQHVAGERDDGFKLVVNWRIRIPKEWLEEDTYQITVRLKKEANGAYADTQPTTLNLIPQVNKNDSQLLTSRYANIDDATLLTSTPNEQLHLYLAPRALPRAYVAKSCTQNASNEETMAFLTESDSVLDGEVLLTPTNMLPPQLCANYQGEFNRVSIESDFGSKMTLGKVSGPALVVVNDYHYPGWKANDLISGEKLDIVKANSIFRAIYLPENKDYELKLNYHPWWLNWVYGLLVLAVLLMAASWRWLIKNQPNS